MRGIAAGSDWFHPIPISAIPELGYETKMDLLSEVRDAWGWVGIDPVGIIDQNNFGNLIIKDRGGKYWRLCPEDVYCEVIAKDCDELNDLLNDPQYLEDWRMSALVEAARKRSWST